MSSSVHVDYKRKDILNLGEGLTQGFNDIKLRNASKIYY